MLGSVTRLFSNENASHVTPQASNVAVVATTTSVAMRGGTRDEDVAGEYVAEDRHKSV